MVHMPQFLRDKIVPPVEEPQEQKCRTNHANALYQPGHTHKFCPDCVTWLPDENHPDNQPQPDNAVPEV